MMHETAMDLLIVEDEPDTRFLLSEIFMMRGYKVRTAGDGFAALAMIRVRSPNLLLSDLNMPGMSGFELLSVVRRLYPLIYVVASSGAYSGTHVPNGIAADGFHEKATGMTSLISLILTGADQTPSSLPSQRMTTPQWVNLQEAAPSESRHVLINCPECLRPFQQSVEKVNAEIRNVRCRYCGGRVDYAIAFAVKPATAAQESRNPTVAQVRLEDRSGLLLGRAG
jgi:CheY-like chemotaxis protein